MVFRLICVRRINSFSLLKEAGFFNTMMGKSQKISKKRPVGFIPDYRNVVETVGESEVFASPTRIDSEDSCAPNPKSTRLNAVKTKGFDVPLQFFSLSKLSLSEKKELESQCRGEF
ncbi:transcription factor GTE9-like protein [Carex littledalei]|uniref:Transcription factor GTE9-like protein n=1 Tax=Carex littledalei TaxID=544730 RepID=A0A833RCU7_9POAL|nr:transcription factor GTE9-like protein [Carex littledalei]